MHNDEYLTIEELSSCTATAVTRDYMFSFTWRYSEWPLTPGVQYQLQRKKNLRLIWSLWKSVLTTLMTILVFSAALAAQVCCWCYQIGIGLRGFHRNLVLAPQRPFPKWFWRLGYLTYSGRTVPSLHLSLYLFPCTKSSQDMNPTT